MTTDRRGRRARDGRGALGRRRARGARARRLRAARHRARRRRAVPARAPDRAARLASLRPSPRPPRCWRGLVGSTASPARRPIRSGVASGTSTRPGRREGQPRPGPFGTSAIANLDGHPLELRARGSLQQGAILEVSGSLARVPPLRRELRRAHLAGAAGRARDAGGSHAGRARPAGRHRGRPRRPPARRARRAPRRRRRRVEPHRDRRGARRHGLARRRHRARTSAPPGSRTCWPSRAATSCCSSPPCSASGGSSGCPAHWRTAVPSPP